MQELLKKYKGLILIFFIMLAIFSAPLFFLWLTLGDW